MKIRYAMAPVFITVFGLSLAGCATTQTVADNHAMAVSPEQSALTESIRKVERVTDQLRTAESPYKGFPLPLQSEAASNLKTTDPHLNALTDVQWTGPASTLLQSIADKTGYKFVNNINGAAPDVTINKAQITVIDEISEIAHQLPSGNSIDVSSGVITLK